MLTDYEKKTLIEAAIQAPSADNSQPFQYKWQSEYSLELWIDPSRSGKASDNRYVLSDIALGAVIENVVIKASSMKCSSKIEYFPESEEVPLYIALITFTPTENTANTDLANTIPQRHTNRQFPFKGPIPEDVQNNLSKAAQQCNSTVMWFNGKKEIKSVLPIIQEAESIRFKSKTLHQELFSTVNFDNPSIEEGMHISVLAIEKPAQPMFKQLKKWKVMNWLNKIGGYAMLGFRSVKVPILFSPALLLVKVDKKDRVSVIEGGRAIQRVWLQAHQHGLSVQPYAAPGIFSLGYIESEEEFKPELSQIAKKMRNVVSSGYGLMFLRLGYAKQMQYKTNRRLANSFERIE